MEIDGKQWEISIELSNDPAIGDWLAVSDEPWDGNVRRLKSECPLPIHLCYSIAVPMSPKLNLYNGLQSRLHLAEITARDSEYEWLVHSEGISINCYETLYQSHNLF